MGNSSLASGLAPALMELARRCLQEQPNQEIDAAIYYAIDPSSQPSCWPDYTSSTDAAMSLLAVGDWGVNWDIESVFAGGFPGNIAVCTYVWVGHPTYTESFVRSPGSITFADAAKWIPRLICCAALRAMASKKVEEGAKASAPEPVPNPSNPEGETHE